MVSAIAVQATSPAWTKDGGQFIPHPSTWLNEGRWQDGEAGDGDNAAVGAWHETRGGVEKRAASIGLPKWDECERWSDYRARVLDAAKETA